MSRPFLIVLLLVVVQVPVRATVSLPKVLAHRMVLQRNQPLAIWGKASPGEAVTVQFGGQVKRTQASAAGDWQVTLEAMPASAAGRELVISGTNTIRLSDVLVGEVWLCSGQSNMEYTMRKNSKVQLAAATEDSPVDELQRANDPLIRVFLVTSKNLRAPDSLHNGWSIARDSALRSFSAPAYFFAKKLRGELQVPIGVISAAIPGSAIEPWLPGGIDSAATFSNESSLQLDSSRPGKFYTGMIRPLAPLAIKGIFWYQGETNCFQGETVAYTLKLESLIRGWRMLWHDERLPFYFVQIAPFYYSKNPGKYALTTETLPRFWEAQQQALETPFTGMIVTTDLVDSPADLHPGYKWEIGRRLALLALSKTYGFQVAATGPVFHSFQVNGNQLVVSFDGLAGGLKSSDGKPLRSFEIAGADGKFYPAQAQLVGDRVSLSSPRVVAPAHARFGWDEGGKFNFVNGEGLPAMPFRTDRNGQ